MDDTPEERRRRRRYRTMGPWWPPWADPRFRSPPEVFYPGPYPWDPFMPTRARRVDEITWLEDRLDELEDEKVEIEQDIEDVRKEIERRKRGQGTETKEK